MTTVRELHKEAMRLAQLALVARHSGDHVRAKQLSRDAYKLEAQAADLVPDDETSEPTRSILYRSAASLAYQCDELYEAQRLIGRGLAGYPPPNVEEELKQLYDQVNFEQHLQVKGVVLADADFQLSIAGNAVSAGIILYKEFVSRIEQTKVLIDRTVQRLMGKQYQRSGAVAKRYKPFEPALSVPRPSSFAITFKLTQVDGQRDMFVPDAKQVVTEILTGIELVNNADENALKNLIHQTPYYRSFVNTTRALAPDGDRVTFVGFTSNDLQVSLTRPRPMIGLVTPQESEEVNERKPIIVEGVLDYAASRKADIIGLTTSDGKEYTIAVEEGMDDLVLSYWKQQVIVSGTFDGHFIYPRSIDTAD